MPAEKREGVAYAHQGHGISIGQACRLLPIAAWVYYYQPKPCSEGEVLEALRELAQAHSGWGFWLMYHRLRKCHYQWNHKRV
jgi:putative transposase